MYKNTKQPVESEMIDTEAPPSAARHNHLVSIVMAVYNGEKYLGEAIDSVLHQTYSNWELIVVNDGSPDASEEIIRKAAQNDPRIRLLNQPNQGVANARNNGFRAASSTARYVLFFDQDDKLMPNAIDLLADALERDKEAPASHGLKHDFGELAEIEYQPTDSTEDQSGARQRTEFEAFLTHNPINTPGMVLIRRSWLEENGAFDPSVAPCDDRDLYQRIARNSHLTFVNQPVLYYRLHTENNSRNFHLMICARHLLAKKDLDSKAYTSDQKKSIKRGFRERHIQGMKYHLAAASSSLKRERCETPVSVFFGLCLMVLIIFSAVTMLTDWIVCAGSTTIEQLVVRKVNRRQFV